MLTVFPDGLGRLMGKRVVGRYFLDHVLADGVHACIYLFTVDMEMEPLPGFKLASWERGYGDMKLVPDLATWRLLPWLPKTALVFCDVYTEEGEPIEEAPRWVLRRQIERAKQQGFLVQTASELELYLFQRVLRRGARQALSRPHPGVELPRGLPHPADLARRRGSSAPSGTTWRRRGCPSSSRRASGGEGQEEINLRYAEALEMADRHVLYKHGVKEIAWAQGASVTFMAKYDMGAAGSSFHLHSSVWDPRGTKNLFAAHGSRAGTPLFQHWLAGQMAMARELRLFLRADDQRVQALPGGQLRADAHRVRLGQPHVRLPPLRRGRELPGGEPDPGRRRESLSRLRRHHRRRASRRRGEARAARPLRGQCVRGCARSPQVPKTLREALDELDRSAAAREAFGSKVVEHYLHHGRLEQQAFDQAVTDWELIRHFERI